MTEQRRRREETSTQARTRRAILDAAVMALAKRPGASLGDVAAAAEVGRTTLHRYFPERSDLIAAVGDHVLEQVAAATTRARLDDGSALDALRRLCQELFELGDVLTLMFTDPSIVSGEAWETETESDRALLRLVERGHVDGVIDSELDPTWVQNLLWALLYAAWENLRSTGASKHDTLALCLRCLTKAVGS